MQSLIDLVQDMLRRGIAPLDIHEYLKAFYPERITGGYWGVQIGEHLVCPCFSFVRIFELRNDCHLVGGLSVWESKVEP